MIPQYLLHTMYVMYVSTIQGRSSRCQVNIGIPENGHPGSPFSRKYTHADAHIYLNTGIGVPIFMVNMGIPL